MSSKKTPFLTWDEIAADAAHDPYELKVSDDHTITIEVPSGAQLIQAGRALRSGDDEALLYALTGEAWEEVEPLLAKAGYKAMVNLATELLVFFDMAEPVDLVGPGGGGKPRTVKDPREVQRLIRAGWTPVGEAASRS